MNILKTVSKSKQLFQIYEQPCSYKYRNNKNLLSKQFNTTEQSPHWEAGSCSAGQEIPRHLRNRKVLSHIQKNQPLGSILSPLKPLLNLTPYFLKDHFNIILPSTPNLPSGLSPSGFPTKIFCMHSHIAYAC
jgi:hypothetical protein